ncbi:MAG: beta-lactamase family protein [Acidobacteriia bacterium]|nr:beta-lactamase family protein [Terriglobia bacterium]
MTNRARILCVLAVILLLPVSIVHAQTGVNLLGDSAAARVDKIFERYSRQDCPGCSLGIEQDGKVVYTRGYGMANLEYSVPITPATIFEAGSVSKQFTTGAIQILARRGKLSLDDDIRKYLPEVPDFGSKITIRHLLSHTSGLRDQWELFTVMGRPPGSAVHTLDEILDLVSRQKELNFPPGTQYLYSNTGFALLAWIVRRASGVSLAEFDSREIFQPLGMTSTQWRDDHTRIVKGRATAYSTGAQGEYHSNMPFTNVYGNGGLLTTAGDLLIWNRNFENPRVIGRESLDEMQIRTRLNDGSSIIYGLGLQVAEYKGVREISHSGSTAGYRAFLARYPDQHLSIALLCNLANVNAGALAHQVAEVFLEGKIKDRAKPVRVEVPAEQIQRAAGLYRNLLTDAVLRLTVQDGKLMLGMGQGNELVPVGENRFEASGGAQYLFVPGQPIRLEVVTAGERPAIYHVVPAVTPSAQQLAEYAGNYYSEELEVSYNFSVRDGRLFLKRRLMPEVAVTATYADAFNEGGRSIRFTRNRAGEVDGLSLSSGRVLHLRFIRRPNLPPR